MALLHFNLDFDTETGKFTVSCNGEEQSVIIPVKKSSTRSKKITDIDPNPKVTLEDSKYSFNAAAVSLLGIEPEDRIDVKYMKVGDIKMPVIGKNEAFGTKGGNRLTKSFTVACKGKNHDELSSYGSVFSLSPLDGHDGLYIMKDPSAPEEELTKAEEIVIPDDSPETDIQIDLDSLVNLDDNDSEEVSSLDFNLND